MTAKFSTGGKFVNDNRYLQNRQRTQVAFLGHKTIVMASQESRKERQDQAEKSEEPSLGGRPVSRKLRVINSNDTMLRHVVLQ